MLPPQSVDVPSLENDPFTAPPTMESNPFSMNSTSAVPVPATDTSSVARATIKGKELAQRGKEEFTKGAKEVMNGLAAAKDAMQARLKLNALNAQVVATYRSLGDAAEKAGWGGELCETIRKQRAGVDAMISQQEKATADVELTKGTAGVNVAKQALSEAKKRLALTVGVLDGLREKVGRALLEDGSAPADIGTEQRAEIARLREQIAECERIIAHGKKSLLTKPMLVAASILLLVMGILGFALSSRSPEERASRNVPARRISEDVTVDVSDPAIERQDHRTPPAAETRNLTPKLTTRTAEPQSNKTSTTTSPRTDKNAASPKATRSTTGERSGSTASALPLVANYAMAADACFVDLKGHTNSVQSGHCAIKEVDFVGSWHR